MRTGSAKRKTGETDVSVDMNLDSLQRISIKSGVPFFDHMLEAMARHGRFGLDITCTGDTEVDDHHSVEDIGLVMGEALDRALDNRGGIRRFGEAMVPMDDALSQVVIDISGRPWFEYRGEALKGYIGSYSEELTIEFLRALSQKSGLTLHLILHNGENRHHIHESIFKALGVALSRAWAIDTGQEGEVPSTKGVIS
jgi:imidazoleglycerol-phosphate dehydratase